MSRLFDAIAQMQAAPADVSEAPAEASTSDFGRLGSVLTSLSDPNFELAPAPKNPIMRSLLRDSPDKIAAEFGWSDDALAVALTDNDLFNEIADNPQAWQNLRETYKRIREKPWSLGGLTKALVGGLGTLLPSPIKGIGELKEAETPEDVASAMTTTFLPELVAPLVTSAGGAGRDVLRGRGDVPVQASLYAGERLGKLLSDAGRKIEDWRRSAGDFLGEEGAKRTDSEWDDEIFTQIEWQRGLDEALGGKSALQEALGLEMDVPENEKKLVEHRSIAADLTNFIPAGGALKAVRLPGAKIGLVNAAGKVARVVPAKSVQGRVISALTSTVRAADRVGRIKDYAARVSQAGAAAALSGLSKGAAMAATGVETLIPARRFLAPLGFGAGLADVAGTGGTIAAGALSAAVAPSTLRYLSRASARTAGKIRGTVPHGPIWRAFDALTKNQVAQAATLGAKGALGLAGEAPIARLSALGFTGLNILGADTEEELVRALGAQAAVGAVVGAGAGIVPFFDVSGMVVRPSRTPFPAIASAPYPTSNYYNQAHNAAIAKLPQGVQNAINTWREVVRNDAEVYVLDPTNFSNVVRATHAQKLGRKLTEADIQALDNGPAFAEGLFEATRPSDGKKMIFLNQDGSALNHEGGHLLESLLPDEMRTQLRDTVRSNYSPDELAAFKADYEQQLGRPITGDELVGEILAENLSAVLNSVPVHTLGTPAPVARRIYSSLAAFLEDKRIPLQRSQKAQDFNLRLDMRLNHMLENVLRAQRAGQDVGLGPVANVDLSQVPIRPAAPAQTAGAAVPNIRVSAADQNRFQQPMPEINKSNSEALAAVDADPSLTPEQKQAAVQLGAVLQQGGRNPYPVEINYRSVNTAEPGKPTGRVTRRMEQAEAYVAEALGALPAAIRSVFQKLFLPDRFEVKGGKVQVLAKSVDKILANAYILTRDAAARGAQIPYEVANGRLTERGWTELIRDIQAYTRNQANGYRGDGQRLTRPASYVGDIPAETPGYTPVPVANERALFVNILMGSDIAPPKTARSTRGVPANVAARQLAEANLRPVVPSTLARPGQKFTKFGDLPIGEPNPLRDAYAKAGVNIRNLLDVNERLLLNNIVSPVKVRTDLDISRPVTDIMRAGFKPRAPRPAGSEFLYEETFTTRDGTPKTVRYYQTPGDEQSPRGLTIEEVAKSPDEVRAEYPEVYAPERMQDVGPDQIPVEIEQADGSVVPGLFNGYYDMTLPGRPPLMSIAKWSDAAGGWSHGILPAGDRIISEVPPYQPREAAAAAFKPAPIQEDRARTGLAFKDFFSRVTRGQFGKSAVAFQPELDITPAAGFAQELLQHTGNFDEHIAKSIPTFRETQVRKGQAIVDTFPEGGRMLDIAGSEGSFAKAITAASGGKIQTVVLDPNPDMARFFRERSQVAGSEYVEQAFKEGFREDDGRVVEAYQPAEPFDIVHESMGFQFINPDREGQIAEAARMMKPDGLLIVEEKVRNPKWAENEAFKDREHKSRYYSTEELAAKDKVVGFQQAKTETKAVGMVDNMVDATTLENVLKKNFSNVAQYWDSGNFRGYVASNSPDRISTYLDSLGDINSRFSTEQTPRIVAGEPTGAFKPARSAEGGFQPENAADLPRFNSLRSAWMDPDGKLFIVDNHTLDIEKLTGDNSAQALDNAIRKGWIRVNISPSDNQVLIQGRTNFSKGQRAALEDLTFSQRMPVVDDDGITRMESPEEGAAFKPASSANIRREMTDTGPGYRAYIGGKKAGELLFTILPPGEGKPVRAFVDYVGVDPAFRRQGVGEDLYRALGRELQQKGIRQIEGDMFAASAARLRNRVFGKPLKTEGPPEAELTENMPGEIDSDTAHRKVISYVNPTAKFKPASERTFTKAGIEELPTSTEWAILTATNPKGRVLSESENATRQAGLEKELQAAGRSFVSVWGKYGDPTEVPGFAVYGIKPDEALAHAKNWDQESILTRSGYLFDDGTVAPAKGFSVYSEVPGDFYTRTPDNTYFTFDIDFADRGPVALQRLPGSIQEDGLSLIHYSGRDGLTTVSPKFFGKGKATPVDLRGGPKSYWFVEGSETRADKPLTQGSVVYRSEIPGAKIYDATADPLGWRKIVNREAADDMLKAAGYEGLRIQSFGRDVVALFNDQPTTRVGRAPQEGMDRAGTPEGETTFKPRAKTQENQAELGFPTGEKKALGGSIQNLSAARFMDADNPAAELGLSNESPKEVGKRLAEWSRSAMNEMGVRFDETSRSAKARRLMAEALYDEIQWMQRNNPDPTTSGRNWYSAQVKKMMDLLSSEFPEFKERTTKDQQASTFFKAIESITSNGQKPEPNLRHAIELYRKWRETGVLDVSQEWGGTRSEQINIALGRLDELWKTLGPAKAREFLLKDFTVRELEKLGYDVSGESPDTVVPGSIIFGPKIGGGFFQNLHGRFNFLTMDLWFSRTMNRINGSYGRVNPETVKTKIAEGRELLAQGTPEQREVATKSDRAVRDYGVELAKKVDAEYSKKIRKKGDTKTPIEYWAKRMQVAAEALSDSPRGPGERSFWREVFAEIDKILEEKGEEPMTNADKQAVLWYFEKRLYSRFTKKKGETVDYAMAAQNYLDNPEGQASPKEPTELQLDLGV